MGGWGGDRTESAGLVALTAAQRSNLVNLIRTSDSQLDWQQVIDRLNTPVARGALPDRAFRLVSAEEHAQLVNARDGLENAHHRLDMMEVPRYDEHQNMLTVAGRLQMLKDRIGRKTEGLNSVERARFYVRWEHHWECPKAQIQTNEFACSCAVQTAYLKLRELGVIG